MVIFVSKFLLTDVISLIIGSNFYMNDLKINSAGMDEQLFFISWQSLIASAAIWNLKYRHL